MANELRKNIARNMRLAEENDWIDDQIQKYEGKTDMQSQGYVDNLLNTREANKQRMISPMSEAEYQDYNDNGDYIPALKNKDGLLKQAGEAVVDGINHFAQGASLGWSDEANGLIGGVGGAAANGVVRAFGGNVNGESMTDAFKKGYREYRDAAREALDTGYERSPVISRTAEVAGSAFSPIKPFKTKGYTEPTFHKFVAHPTDIAKARRYNALGTGAIAGMGYVKDNTPGAYAANIGIGAGMNMAGNSLGNDFFGTGNNMNQIGRAMMNAGVQAVPHLFDSSQNLWKKKDE